MSDGIIVKIEDLFVISDLIGGNNIKTHLLSVQKQKKVGRRGEVHPCLSEKFAIIGLQTSRFAIIGFQTSTLL
jgi:hypothetical protein